MKRRDFLTRVGLVGGAGAMYGTMDAMGLVGGPAGIDTAQAQPAPGWDPPGRSDFALKGRARKRVVVLGAGIAGLATAYELGKAGYETVILEARDRPGGRNWTIRGGTVETDLDGVTQKARFDDGIYMNGGPARLPGHHVTLDYCRELGVEIEAFTNQNADSYYFNEGVGGLSSKKIRHRTAKADVYGYVAEMLSKATDQGALDAYLTDADKERLISLMQSWGAVGRKVTGDSAASYKYTGTNRRGYIVDPGAGTQSGVVDGPPHALAEVLESGIGRYFSFEFGWDQAMMMFQPAGGMDRIPYALDEHVRKAPRSSIAYGAEVQEIANTPEGVRVLYAGKNGKPRMVEGDFCVCTIPPMVLKKITTNFSQPVKDALAFAQGVATGKIGLQYKRRWWEEDEKIFGGITNTNMDLSTIWYPSYGYLGRKGLVVGYYNFGGNAVTYGNLSPAEREARALMQGEKIHGPSYSSELETSFSVAWQKTKYSEGGWVSWPSRTSGEYERLLQAEGNTYFAGDHLSHYIAWQAGAFESARKAVMDLHTRVMAA